MSSAGFHAPEKQPEREREREGLEDPSPSGTRVLY